MYWRGMWLPGIRKQIWWNWIFYWMGSQLMQWQPLFIIWRHKGSAVNWWINWRSSLTGMCLPFLLFFPSSCSCVITWAVFMLTGKCLRYQYKLRLDLRLLQEKRNGLFYLLVFFKRFLLRILLHIQSLSDLKSYTSFLNNWNA